MGITEKVVGIIGKAILSNAERSKGLFQRQGTSNKNQQTKK